MKELSIEEKAERYDEAIKVAKSNYETIVQMDNDCTFAKEGIVNTFHHIFPELKESEDERIRKGIVKSIMDLNTDWLELHGVTKENALAWLEKQGESTDILADAVLGDNNDGLIADTIRYKKQTEQKSEQKFKDGDWIIDDDENVFHITIDNNNYQLETLEGKLCHCSYKIIEKKFRLWTIKDAKVGDVLVCGKCILIFDQLSEFNNEQVLMDICHCDSKGFYWQNTKDRDLWTLDGFKPATKEQRDLLFSSMKDAGYGWDTEKKELKKIEQKSTDKVEPKFKIKYAGREYNVLEVKDIAGVTFYGIEDEPNHIDYVKAENCERVCGYNIKEKGSPYPTKHAVFSEQNHAWSEEDEEIYQSIIDDTVQENQLNYKQTNWLKSLKDRVQPKVELTLLDKNVLEAAIAFVEQNNHFNCWRGVDKHTVLSALYSLRPQDKKWKPNKNQLTALYDAIERYKGSFSVTLESLYNDLKSIK